MDETSLNQALASGGATIEPAEEPQTSESATNTITFEEFVPMLQELQSVQSYLSAAPTFVPQTWQEQIQLVYTGAKYYLYIYFNNQWNSIQLGTSSSAPVTGTSPRMGPPGGFANGIVEITDPAILSTSKVLFSRNQAAGTLGDISIYSITTGSVYLASSNPNDTSTFNYAVYN